MRRDHFVLIYPWKLRVHDRTGLMDKILSDAHTYVSN
jgi:hypothetical protein